MGNDLYTFRMVILINTFTYIYIGVRCIANVHYLWLGETKSFCVYIKGLYVYVYCCERNRTRLPPNFSISVIKLCWSKFQWIVTVKSYIFHLSGACILSWSTVPAMYHPITTSKILFLLVILVPYWAMARYLNSFNVLLIMLLTMLSAFMQMNAHLRVKGVHLSSSLQHIEIPQ